jgi:hypothetical protein
MTTSAPAVTPPTSAELRAIVDRAIDRYIAARHDKVAAFVDGNYSLLGSLACIARRLVSTCCGLRPTSRWPCRMSPRNLQRQAWMPPVPTGWPIASGDRRCFSTPTLHTS